MSVGPRFQNFEFGTAGSALSTSNPPTSNGQTAAGGISVTGTGVATVINTDAQNGSQCLETSQTTTAASDSNFRWQGYTTVLGTMRGGFKCVGTVPTSGTQTIFRSFVSGTRWLSVNINSTGHLVLAISNADTIVWTSAAVLSPNVWYGIQFQFSDFGSGTTDLTFAYYTDDYTTPVETPYSTTTGATGAGTAMVDIRFGRSAMTVTNTIRFDNLAFDDTTTTAIGPAGAYTGTASLAVAASTTAAGSLAGNTGTASLAVTAATTASGSIIDASKVMILGDSLTSQSGNGPTDITTAFVAAGYTSGQLYIDGLSSRAIWDGHGATPYSSTAIDTMRATGFEPKTYVVALGTNNTGFLVSDTMVDYRALMAKIGPGRVVHFIGLGYQDITECRVQYNAGAALGARWSELNTVAGRPNAAILNIVEQGVNPLAEPTVQYHDWNDYGPLRTAGTAVWDATDTSSPGGLPRHMVRTGYQSYRNPFYAGASLGVIYGDAIAAVVAAITAAGMVGPVGQAALTITATVTAAGFVATSKVASLAATAAATAAGVVGESTGASLIVTATTAGAGVVGGSTTSALTAAATITAAGTVTATGAGSAFATATATVTAAGFVATGQTAGLASSATVTAAGFLARSTTATRTAVVTITAAGTVSGTGTVRDITVSVATGVSRHPLATTGTQRWDT
jgi:hypothetical protein